MRGTKEFYEMQTQFEKDIKTVMYGHKIERTTSDDNAPSTVFYHDGHVNQLFRAYMLGYSSAKKIYQN